MPNFESNELSDREQEILKLVATGASNKEIAYKLVISPNTVKVHLRNIFTKIGAASRTEAAMYAVQNGLVTTLSPQNGLNLLPSTTLDRSRKEQWIDWVRSNRIAVILGILLLLSMVVVIQLSVNQSQETGENTRPLLTEESRWKRLADMPTARAGLAGASDGTKIYAIGGETENGVTGIVEIYDILTGTWSVGAEKPTPVKDIQAVMIGGKIYIPGGIKNNGSPTNEVELFNTISGNWEQASPLPLPLSDYAAIEYDGKLYTFGGWDGKQSRNTVFSYDPDLNQWQTIASMNNARMSFGAAIIENNAWLIGGWDGTNPLSEVEIFPFSTDSSFNYQYEEIILPEARYGVETVSIFDNIYILSGHSLIAKDDKPYGYLYSISNNEWGEVPGFPMKETIGSAAVWIESNIYIIGGKLQDKFTGIAFLYEALNIYFIPLVK